MEIDNNRDKKRLKINHDNYNINDFNKNKTLIIPNVILIKILNYLIEDSLKNDKFYTLYGTLSLICKSWSLFLLPKLHFDESLFRNNTLYSYIKVGDTIRYLMNSNQNTSFKLCRDNMEMNSTLDLLESPTVITGTYNINASEEVENYDLDYKIYIDKKECGTIFNPNINMIEMLSNPSSFGKDDKIVYDEQVRKGFHIDGDRVNVPYFNYNNPILNYYCPITSNQYLKKNFNFKLKLYKIHIYKEGGHFNEHIDSIQSKDHIGTYIVPLGDSIYEGGEFVISENETFDKTTLEYKIEASQDKINKDIYQFKWIAFYNDCIHKINKVTKGTRIVLQFNIYINNNKEDAFYKSLTNKPDLIEARSHYEDSIKYSNKHQFLTYNLPYDEIDKCIDSNETVLNKVNELLDQQMAQKDVNTGIFLVHLYKAHVNENHLKGLDRIIWDQLKAHYGENRIKIRTFIITNNKEEDFQNDEIWDYQNSYNIKIAMVAPKTINQPPSIIKYSNKDTLLFCGLKYSSFKSIYSRPSQSIGNEERSPEDLGCFSAIIISNPN